MIIIRLIGGLGNQCFQYAVGRHLAEIHNTELKIDLSEYETYKLHKYSLGHLNIKENFASSEEIASSHKVREKHLHFDPEILSLPDGVLLQGYWGTEKYFTGIADIIRREFAVKQELSGRDKEMARLIASSESVSVHIRRADYLQSVDPEQIVQSCGLGYYAAAVARIAGVVAKPHFFVFTDDKAWVLENFKLQYPFTLVDHNGPDKNYEDMRLMSLCRNNIITNSTFSWWAAWLNNYPGKIVIAPNKWFTEKARNSAKDVIPDSWVKV